MISANPGTLLNAPESAVFSDQRSGVHERPLVLTGRVPVKIDPQSEPIAVGDYLTSSAKPGLAMKATRAGQVIGIALESFNPDEPKTKVLCFINPTPRVDPAQLEGIEERLRGYEGRLERVERILRGEASH